MPSKTRKRKPVDAPSEQGESKALTRYRINAIEKTYKSIDPGDVVEALQHSLDPRAIKLLEVMEDSAFAQHSFALKCRAANITAQEVWKLVIDLHKINSEMRVAAKLPRIVDSLTDDALPRTIPCPKHCQKGRVVVRRKGEDVEEDCRACSGMGSILIPGDVDARKMSLEIAGMIGQRAPLIDARQVHFGGAGAGVGAPDLSDWSRSTDDMFEERGAYRRPQTVKAIDAEEVPSHGE